MDSRYRYTGPLLGSVRSLYWCDGGYFFASFVRNGLANGDRNYYYYSILFGVRNPFTLTIHPPCLPYLQEWLNFQWRSTLNLPTSLSETSMTDDLYSVHVAVPVHRRRTIASHQFVWRFHDDDDDEWTRILLQWVRCDNIITLELAVRVLLCTQSQYICLLSKENALFGVTYWTGTSGWTLIMLGLYLFANYHNFPSFCSPHRGHWSTANFNSTIRDRIAHQ